ncbi:MAG: MlaD family protein [Planctomycetota bacterium]
MNPTNQWKLGLFVAVALALGFAGLVFFGANRLNRESFPIVTYFGESVEGLDVGSPVKFRGVQLGRVKEITFAPNQKDVQVTCEIFLETVQRLGLRDSAPDANIELSLELEGLRLQLVRSGITGVAFLEADIFDTEKIVDAEYDFELPWNFVPSQPSVLRSIETGLEETLDTLPDVLADTRNAIQTFEQTLSEARVAEVSDEILATLASARGLSDDIREAGAGELVGETRELVRSYQAVASDISAGVETLSTSLGRIDGLIATVEADLNRAGLSEAVDAVRDAARNIGSAASDGSALTLELRQELRTAGETLESLRRLIDLLERDPSVLIKGRK